MTRNFVVIIFLFLTSGNLFSQSVQGSTITYTPPDNGYVLNVPFKWKFINCYGEVHVTITKNSKDITSTAYIYNGKRYTQSELGAEAFSKPECGLTDIMVDMYDGAYRLGEAKLGNVIDWLGGCFGQTYHITELIGLEDEKYKDKLSGLSLKNIRFLEISSRDYGLEGKIKELEKENALKNKLEEADRAFESSDLETAKKLYREAIGIKYDNAHAKNRIKEIDERLKEENKKSAFQEQMKKAQALYDTGDYEAAKAEFEKALTMNPEDSEAKNMVNAINEKLEAEKERKEAEKIANEEKAEKEDAENKRNEEARTAASNRRHKGLFWGKDPNSFNSQAGSAFQNTNFIGLFKVEYDIWSLVGEPAHRFKFYWEWNNALYTGYPQYVSVLGDEVIQIAELKKYPALLERWNNIKPLYVEIVCDISSYKNGDKYVADAGTIKIIPEIIGKSGEQVGWSAPASPQWDELFTYANDLNWDYFRNRDLWKEIDEYSEEFSDDIAWAKYAFEYSDKIDFFQMYQYMSSEFTSLTDVDLNNYSVSASFQKVVWPEEEIMAILDEFNELEKRAEEENMAASDFWNTAENKERTKSENFWDTPNNSKIIEDVERERINRENLVLLDQRKSIIERHREKYEALQNPFTITNPRNNSTVKRNVIEVSGKINEYFQKNSNQVFLNLSGVKQEVNISNGAFSNPIVLANGQNNIQLELQGRGFKIKSPHTVFYEGVDTDIRVTLTWNGSGDLDLWVENPDNILCNYNNKGTQAMTLDVDNTQGYGPENISVVNGVHGTYSITVQNFSNAIGKEATVYIFKNEELVAQKKHTFSYNKEKWHVDDIQLN
ncbi:hypothetical protein [Salegentibacter sp. F14]